MKNKIIKISEKVAVGCVIGMAISIISWIFIWIFPALADVTLMKWLVMLGLFSAILFLFVGCLVGMLEGRTFPPAMH